MFYAPPWAKPYKVKGKTPLITGEETFRRNAEARITPPRDGKECNGCHNGQR
jgi:hypothetical protein